MNEQIETVEGEFTPVDETAVVVRQSFDMAQANPEAAFERAEAIVKHMAAKCTGPQFVAQIQGRAYPKVEWWTTVGASLGLFPVEMSSVRHEHADEGYYYEAVVEVRHSGVVVTRASAICSTHERSWGNRDEYAVKSMATTRATGKAFRIGLSSLAVMAGLEPTPADEIPPQGFQDRRRAPRQPSTDPMAVARREGLAALRVIRETSEDQQAWVAEHFPKLAKKGGADYTLEDWGDITTLAREQAGQDDLGWGPDHAAADAEADAAAAANAGAQP